MGRPREFDTEVILDLCIQVFACKGYETSSIDDLVKETGLTRASLYNAFGSKKKLYIACLQRFAEVVMAPRVFALLNARKNVFDSVEEFLKSLFSERTPAARIAGCFLINTVIEINVLGDPEVFEAANQPILNLEKLLCKRFSELGRAQSLATAHFVVCHIQGMRVMAKRGAPASQIHTLISALMCSLRTMLLPGGNAKEPFIHKN